MQPVSDANAFVAARPSDQFQPEPETHQHRHCQPTGWGANHHKWMGPHELPQLCSSEPHAVPVHQRDQFPVLPPLLPNYHHGDLHVQQSERWRMLRKYRKLSSIVVVVSRGTHLCNIELSPTNRVTPMSSCRLNSTRCRYERACIVTRNARNSRGSRRVDTFDFRC